VSTQTKNSSAGDGTGTSECGATVTVDGNVVFDEHKAGQGSCQVDFSGP
jgi:hypothetical protein